MIFLFFFCACRTSPSTYGLCKASKVTSTKKISQLSILVSIVLLQTSPIPILSISEKTSKPLKLEKSFWICSAKSPASFLEYETRSSNVLRYKYNIYKYIYSYCQYREIIKVS